MTIPRYTMNTERNAYFNGRDGVLYSDGERVAKIALKDDRPAVYVKHGYQLGTDATKAMRDDLGDEACERILEGLQHDFWWHCGPEDIADAEGGYYDELYSAGRSGGWAVPTSSRDREWKWWDECAIDDPLPEVESADEMSQTDARKYWFFLAAEVLTAEAEYMRTVLFDEAVRDAHYELESRRDAVLVRGEN